MKLCILFNMGIYICIFINKIIFIREYLLKFFEKLLIMFYVVCNIIYNGKILIYFKFNFEI